MLGAQALRMKERSGEKQRKRQKARDKEKHLKASSTTALNEVGRDNNAESRGAATAEDGAGGNQLKPEEYVGSGGRRRSQTFETQPLTTADHQSQHHHHHHHNQQQDSNK